MPATPFLAVCFPNMKHSYDWYEDYLMDVRDEIDADQRETCVKLIRYLLENQVDGCIDWGHIDFQ